MVKMKRFGGKWILVLLSTMIILAVIITGCAKPAPAPAPAPTKDKITIGFSRSLSGMFAAQAEGEQHSVILWSELINEKGGIYVKEYGKKLPVELVYYDDKSQADEVVRIYEKLITDDKVDVLFGPTTTAMTKPVIAVVERYKRPLVTCTSGLDYVAEELDPKYWRMVEPSISNFMPSLAELLAAHKDEIKTIAMIVAQDAYLLPCSQTLTPLLEQEGFDIVLKKDYPLEVTDLSDVLLEVISKNPDAFIALSNVSDGILCLNQSIELGVNPKFYYNCLMSALGPFVDMFGENSEGVMAQAGYSPELPYPSTPTPREYYDLYTARWGIPPDFLNAALGFQGAQVMEQAIEKAGTLDPEKIREVLDTEEFMTIYGPVKFEHGLNVLRVGGVVQYQNGVGELVAPLDIATAELEIPKPPFSSP